MTDWSVQLPSTSPALPRGERPATTCSGMVVMVVCHFDDTNPGGGLEKQAGLLSQRLRDQGERVVLLSSTRSPLRTGWQQINGVPVRLFWTYSTPQISGRYLPAALIWAAQVALWLLLNRAHIRIVHCHQLRIHAFVAALATRLLGIPSILKSATGGDGADIRVIGSHKYFGAAGRRFVVRNATKFIATTESIRDDLLRWGVPDTKIAVVPNGIDRSRLTQPPRSARQRHQRCLYLGRLDQDKNVLALAAAALRHCRELDLTLDFYGKGAQRAELEALIADHADNRVRYCGFVDDVAAVLPDYGYLLLPSNAEGLSNSMIEAMWFGVVPITTRVSGCVDHIEPGVDGLFMTGVDAGSLSATLQGIADIDTESWLRMSKAAQAKSQSRFDLDVIGSAYRQLYAELRVAATP